MYLELHSSFLFIKTTKIPYISYTVSIMCLFPYEPRYIHWSYLKIVLRCMIGTFEYEMRINVEVSGVLVRYCDAD